MWLSGIVGHVAGGLMFHWGSTIKVPWIRTVISLYPPTFSGLVPELWSRASYLTGPLVNSSGAAIVSVLQPVPFPKGASSNYTTTQATHTYMWSDQLERFYCKLQEFRFVAIDYKTYWSYVYRASLHHNHQHQQQQQQQRHIHSNVTCNHFNRYSMHRQRKLALSLPIDSMMA